MSIQKQLIDIPLGGGLEGKVDPKLVQPGRALAIENLEFSAPGAASKRNGYTALSTTTNQGTLSSGRTLLRHKSELLMADGTYLYAWSSVANEWIQRANFYPNGISTKRLPGASSNLSRTIYYVDMAVANNVLLLAYKANDQAELQLYDLNSYTLITSLAISQSPSVHDVRVIASGNYLYAISTTGANLPMYYVDTTAPTSISGPVTIAADANATGNADLGDLDGAGLAVCAYKTTGNEVKVTTFNHSGGVTASTSVAENPAGRIGVTVTAADDVFVAYRKAATGDLRCFALKSDMSSRFAVTTIDTGARYENPVGVESSTDKVRWFWNSTTGAGAGSTRQIYNAIIDSTGSVTSGPNLFLQRAQILTRPYVRNSEVFIGAYFTADVLGLTSIQATAFIVRAASISAAYTIASILPGRSVTEEFIGANSAVQPSSILATSADKYLFAMLGYFENSLIADTSSEFPSPVLTQIDYSYRPTFAELGETTIITSGIVHEYDGEVLRENNFLLSPEVCSPTQAAGGSLADGAYQVAIIYATWNKSGELARSAPVTGAITIAAGGGTAKITITTHPLSYIGGSGSQVNIMAYVSALGGTTLYEYSATALSSGSTSQTIDITSVSGVTDNRILYTDGDVLENGAPPHLQCVISKSNRVYGVTQDAQIWYTKEHVSGESPAFVQETLVKNLRPDGGATYALAEMDARLFAIGERSVQVLTGDGLDDVGASDTLSEPQQIPADVGLVAGSPVIATPLGIMYKSPRGIILIDRSLQPSLIGAAVDGYKSLTTVSAVLVPSKNQVRFGHSDGSCLVLDYLLTQEEQAPRWSVFTNHAQVGAVYLNDKYYFVTSAGQVYQQATTFTDNASSIGIVEETPWIHISALAGMQRVFMLSVLGEWRSAHTLTAKIYLDYDASTIVETVTWDLSTGYTSGQPLQVRHRMGNQCRAIKVRLEDSSQAGTKESLTLAMLTLEVGGKAGVFRLGTAQTG